MSTSNYSEHFREAAQAVFDSLSPERQRRVETIGRMNASYIGTPRDPLLDLIFDDLLENVASALFGKAAKRRAIFIVGESGSGKTTAVERHIAKRPEFAPRIAADGQTVRPLVGFEAPKPLTLKGLARAGLKALHYPINTSRVTEQELFDLWKEQLRENRVLFLWIDEMQHVLRGNATKEIQNVADVLKSLVQIEGWPLHLILSGVPALAQFVHQFADTDRQLKERSNLVELRSMSYPADAAIVRKIVTKIVTGDASLTAKGLDSDDFIPRLMHACNGAFGSTIQLIRAACVYALRTGSASVDLDHFAITYALASGCRLEGNVFLSENWQNIVPDNSLGDLLANAALNRAEVAAKATSKATGRKKAN